MDHAQASSSLADAGSSISRAETELVLAAAAAEARHVETCGLRDIV
jgi:hypothetical protein